MSEITERDTIVRSDEALAVTYNPATHEVTSAELPDGNVMLHVQPKPDQLQQTYRAR